MTSNCKLSSISSESKIQSQLSRRSPESTNADSDDDSGIVAIANSQRIGSNSSNSDEERIYRVKNCEFSNQSICGTKHRVRFDDELHLSEQSIRRSCKKLFDTLFHQNKDNNDEVSANSCQLGNNSFTDNRSLLPSCHCHYFTQTLPSKKSSQTDTSMANICTNSELNLNVNIAQDLENIGESAEKMSTNGLLLQTVEQSFENESYSCPYSKTDSSQLTKRLNTIKGQSVWSVIEKNESNDINVNDCKYMSLDCKAALSRIKSMSDRLESSSMVNAFARPVLIQNLDFDSHKDSVYETIFPINDKNDGKMYSSNVQIKKWLNSDKSESNRSEIEMEENNETKKELINYRISPPLPSDDSKKSALKSTKSILKVLPNTINISQKMITSSMDSSKKALISADQIYPNIDNEDLTDYELSDDSDGEEEKRVECESINKDEGLRHRFSNSYSAGDVVSHKIAQNISSLKSAISETNLHENSDNRKTFIQRFKSVISRAFNTDKLTKQSINDDSYVKSHTQRETDFKSVRNKNTSNTSKSLSQTDLRVNINPNGTNGTNNWFTATNKSTADRSLSESLVKNMKTRISIRKNIKVDIKGNTPERKLRSNDKSKSLTGQKSKCNDNNDNISQVWGELIKLNSNCSQVIQIHRKKGKAFGFFVARGIVNNNKGVFVSRMKDEEIQKSLIGVLEIGDEILAIDGESVKDSNIMRVNQLIANKETIRLTIVPYIHINDK